MTLLYITILEKNIKNISILETLQHTNQEREI